MIMKMLQRSCLHILLQYVHLSKKTCSRLGYVIFIKINQNQAKTGKNVASFLDLILDKENSEIPGFSNTHALGF